MPRRTPPREHLEYVYARHALMARCNAGELTLAELDDALEELAGAERGPDGRFPDRWPPYFRPPGPRLWRAP